MWTVLVSSSRMAATCSAPASSASSARISRAAGGPGDAARSRPGLTPGPASAGPLLKKARSEERRRVRDEESDVSRLLARGRTDAPAGQTPVRTGLLTRDHFLASSTLIPGGCALLPVPTRAFTGPGPVPLTRVFFLVRRPPPRGKT